MSCNSDSPLYSDRNCRVLRFLGTDMTPREVQIIREGFNLGAVWAGSKACRHIDAGRDLFPMPKVTRQREVTIHLATGLRFRALVADGTLYDANSRSEITSINVTEFGAEGLRQLADLFANPTVEVDAE